MGLLALGYGFPHCRCQDTENTRTKNVLQAWGESRSIKPGKSLACPWLSDSLARDMNKTSWHARCSSQWSDACHLESEPVFSVGRKQPKEEGSCKAAVPPNPEGSAVRAGSWDSWNEKSSRWGCRSHGGRAGEDLGEPLEPWAHDVEAMAGFWGEEFYMINPVASVLWVMGVS